ncbi:MAG: FMN-binding protein [Planctomycetota bacterium]
MRKTWQPLRIQLLRVAMLVGLMACLHQQHRRWMAERQNAMTWADVLPKIRAAVPDAAVVSVADQEGAGQIESAEGHRLGSVLRTSPFADHYRGFSGPTDVLLLFDPAGQLTNVEVLSSRDTREHVGLVLRDPRFINSLKRRTFSQLTVLDDVDAVSGATLTSFAILESIRYRVQLARRVQAGADDSTAPDGAEILPTAGSTSLKFPDPPRLEDVRVLYPSAQSVTQLAGSRVLWSAIDASGTAIGRLLRASPVADNEVGYQGPTDLLIAIDEASLVTGIAIGVSFDNEPYVGYVRDDSYFRKLFNGRDPKTLAEMDAAKVEGVSGATMTSQTVTRSLQLTAQEFVNELALTTAPRQNAEQASTKQESSTEELKLTIVNKVEFRVRWRDVSTIVITALGVLIGLTRLRGKRWLRLTYQAVVIGWLGMVNGDLVSQAFFLGAAQSGFPWQTALGLSSLSVAAIAVPITSGRNVYCSHICPHGAVQQLVRRRLPWQLSISSKMARGLRVLPWLLLGWVIMIGLLHLPFSPVDIEPFDAWLWTVAGAATIAVAVISLVASLFIPMAYCRHACPTGALLDFVSSSGGASWTARDTAMAAVLAFAIALQVG